MLHGDTEAIRIEDPGVEKAEFVVTVGSRRELHQAKRSHRSGKWSLATLGSPDVRLLQAIGDVLARNDGVRFVFVSGSEARELAELCEAARDAESVEEFERVFLAARERKQSFERLLGCYWKCAVPTAIERLRRIEVRTIGERDLEDKVRWGTQALFLGDPGKVLSELRAIVEDSVHRTIARQDLVEALCRRGYRMRRLSSPERAGVAVREATDRYLDVARRRLMWCRRWARSGTASTTPWPRAPSPPSNASYSTARTSTTTTRRAEPSSSSSRDGITRIVVTRALVSNPPSPSRGAIRTLHETQALNRPLNRGNSNGNTALKRGLQKHLRRSHRSMIRICSPKQG